MQFMVRTSGMFTIEDAMTIQKLLRDATDDAFPLIMAHKVPKNPILKWVCLTFSAFCTFVVGVGVYFGFIEGLGDYNYSVHLDEVLPSVPFAVLLIISIVGFSQIKPTKKQAFKDYSTILLAYQNNDNKIKQ